MYHQVLRDGGCFQAQTPRPITKRISLMVLSIVPRRRCISCLSLWQVAHLKLCVHFLGLFAVIQALRETLGRSSLSLLLVLLVLGVRHLFLPGAEECSVCTGGRVPSFSCSGAVWDDGWTGSALLTTSAVEGIGAGAECLVSSASAWRMISLNSRLLTMKSDRLLYSGLMR